MFGPEQLASVEMHDDDPTAGEHALAAVAERQQRELATLVEELADLRTALHRTEALLASERQARIEDLARIAVLRHELQVAEDRPRPSDRMVEALVRVLRDERNAAPAPRKPLTDEEVLRRSSYFDGAWYLAHNPDVASAGLDPARHYIAHGAAEGRNPGPAFDTSWYVATNPDAAGTNPLLHFLSTGCVSRRLPAPPDRDADEP